MRSRPRYTAAVRMLAAAVLCFGAACAASSPPDTTRAPWFPDNGDSTYTNPVLFADYSDPDVIRVDKDFILVSSSFNAVPGIPVLQSRDLVSWRIVGHAVNRLPSPVYDLPQHGKGCWAPSIRFHNGEYYVYFGDPDLGIYMTKARHAGGPWDPPTLVKAGKGRIDPCPFWDDDGNAYLVHAWAKSRAGFNGVLTLCRMSADGTKLLDDGVRVFSDTVRHPTIEGPKVYKRNGWYYIFAPAGGVKPGWQTVLRSRSIAGPYEDKIVLARGATAINGPHQGAWVTDIAGQSWFLHFQDRRQYGRVVHLQPMTWEQDWPRMGVDPDGDGVGEPVARWKKPAAASRFRPLVPQTGDEFALPDFGPQWQWEANPQPGWYSLAARPGWMRLFARPVPGGGTNLWTAPNLMLQKFPAPAFQCTAAFDPDSLARGVRAGLVVMGYDYAFLHLEKTPQGTVCRLSVCADAQKGTAERIDGERMVRGARAVLKISVDVNARCVCACSVDGGPFEQIGTPFQAREGAWVGAKLGLAAIGTAGPGRFADIDWFRITAP